jgi:hypothetical protein
VSVVDPHGDLLDEIVAARRRRRVVLLTPGEKTEAIRVAPARGDRLRAARMANALVGERFEGVASERVLSVLIDVISSSSAETMAELAADLSSLATVMAALEGLPGEERMAAEAALLRATSWTASTEAVAALNGDAPLPDDVDLVVCGQAEAAEGLFDHQMLYPAGHLRLAMAEAGGALEGVPRGDRLTAFVSAPGAVVGVGPVLDCRVASVPEDEDGFYRRLRKLI